MKIKRLTAWSASLLLLSSLCNHADGQQRNDLGATSSNNLDLKSDDDFLSDQNAKPEIVDGRFVIPPMEARSTATAEVGNGKIPEGFRAAEDRPLQSLPESGVDRNGNWNWSLADWSAPNTYSNPRYFEDRMLERHGHERFGCAQSAASGVRFFATVPMLPYLMAIKDPCECEYTLGYYRPGSCAPLMYQRPPWDRRAILVESAAIATGIIAIP